MAPARKLPTFARLVDDHPAAAACVVALMNLVLKLPGLAERSIWLDEAWTVALGFEHPAAIVFAAANDENPPLYNLFMAGWLQLFGTSEVALRLPSLLASVGCAVALLRFVRRYYGAEAAVYASLLYLVSASQTHHATEGRTYAIIGLLCVLSFHLYLSLLERPRWATAIALGTANAAGLYAHYTIGLAYVAQGLCALALVATRRRGFALYVASQLLTLALFAPFVHALLANLPRAGASWLPAPDLATLHAVVRELAGSRSALRAGLALVAGMLLWRAVVRRRTGATTRTVADERVLIAAAWAVLPLLLAFAVSQRVPILHVRYELFAGLGWMVLIAALLAALPWPAFARTAAALLLVLLSAKASPHASTRDPQWRKVAAIARPAEDSEDSPPIVLVPEVECIPFAYYAAPDSLRFLFADGGRWDPGGLHRQLAEHRILCRDQAWPASSADLTGERIVLILAHADGTDTERILREVGARGYASGEPRDVAGKSIRVLERTPVKR